MGCGLQTNEDYFSTGRFAPAKTPEEHQKKRLLRFKWKNDHTGMRAWEFVDRASNYVSGICSIRLPDGRRVLTTSDQAPFGAWRGEYRVIPREWIADFLGNPSLQYSIVCGGEEIRL